MANVVGNDNHNNNVESNAQDDLNDFLSEHTSTDQSYFAPHMVEPPVAMIRYLDTSRIEEFNGTNYKRWKERVYTLLDMHGVSWVLTTPLTEDTNYALWDQANKICRNTILSTLTNSL